MSLKSKSASCKPKKRTTKPKKSMKGGFELGHHNDNTPKLLLEQGDDNQILPSIMSGGKKHKKSPSKKTKSTSKKLKSPSKKKRSTSSKSKKIMKGGQDIPLFTTTSNDWHDANQKAPLAADLSVGVNEYQFSRTTPDNKFVTSSGVVDTPKGIEMVGGKKYKKSSTKKPSSKKPSSKKPSSSKKPKSIINKIVSGSKNLFEKTKKMIMGNKKKVLKKKSKKTVKK